MGSFADMVCSPAGACDEESDSATINVLIPQPLECDKQVCVDTDNDGTCDLGFGTDLEVPCDATFPLHVDLRDERDESRRPARPTWWTSRCAIWS